MSEITVKYLSEKEILEKEVRSWPTWSCEASEFPWEYIEQESCYILEGQVDITTIDGKIVSILEGGYDLNALKESVDYHVKSLME